MALDFGHGASDGRTDVNNGSWLLPGRSSRPLGARGYLVAIDLSAILQRARLTWSAGEALPWSQQKFGLDLKETGFDRAGARTTGLLIDERVQAPTRIEDQRLRRGHAR
jgi:hypothetical protein